MAKTTNEKRLFYIQLTENFFESEDIGHKGTKVTMQYYSKRSKKRKEMINEAIEEYLSKII